MKIPGVVAFAFGVPSTIRSNQLIASIASKKARELNCRVYTQFDVNILPGIETTYINQQHNNPPPTLRIVKGAIKWATIHGFNTLWIVAAKPHIKRVLRDFKHATKEIDNPIEFIITCSEIEEYPEDTWFCSESTQPRVRSKKDWQKRERILQLMPFFIYKRVAS